MSQQLNILYLEDDAADVELFKLCLARYCPTRNINLVVAASINEAKQDFLKHIYSAVLIDWNLPDGDGYDFAQHIKKNGYIMPVVFLSNAINHSQINKVEECPMSLLLEKKYHKAFIQQIFAHIEQ